MGISMPGMCDAPLPAFPSVPPSLLPLPDGIPTLQMMGSSTPGMCDAPFPAFPSALPPQERKKECLVDNGQQHTRH
eukprot:364860-Chlamydomonas_euryale.AAC.11